MEHLGFIHHHSKMAKGFTKFTFVIWRIFPFAKTHKLHFNRAFEANKKKLELVVKPLPPCHLQQNKFCINSISSCQEYEWCIIIEFCISISDASI